MEMPKRLEELLNKVDKTDDEDMEEDRLLQDYAKENNITLQDYTGED